MRIRSQRFSARHPRTLCRCLGSLGRQRAAEEKHGGTTTVPLPGSRCGLGNGRTVALNRPRHDFSSRDRSLAVAELRAEGKRAQGLRRRMVRDPEGWLQPHARQRAGQRPARGGTGGRGGSCGAERERQGRCVCRDMAVRGASPAQQRSRGARVSDPGACLADPRARPPTGHARACWCASMRDWKTRAT